MMNPAGKSGSGGREPRDSAKEADTKSTQTPNADMQAEDAGTQNSGTPGRGTAAGGAMKQTSKTKAESGTKR